MKKQTTRMLKVLQSNSSEALVCKIQRCRLIVGQSSHEHMLNDKGCFFCSLSFWQGMNDRPNEYMTNG